ncbi:MAG: SufS family cysteine desulfurase [Lachnospiraceae bacterium]|nr:SufS family cysteine desulfurase [Lachnospiraceae bacterium]
MDGKLYRADFPIFQIEKSMYLDNAATSQKPQCVIDAEYDFYKSMNANPLRGFYPLSVKATEAYEEARSKVKGFINAASEKEIIFTRNTTESINLIAYSYGLINLCRGDEIVVSITEHHSNLLPWRMVANRTGAKIKYLYPNQNGEFDIKSIDEAITEKTKIVAMGQVSNVLGSLNPVEYVIKKAHEVGAVAVIDAAQSAPHMPIDVQKMNPDFLAFSGHKMFGPMGIGVLYGKKELLEKMPPFMEGGEMVDIVRFDYTKYSELPHKFEAGTVNAGGAVALGAAIDYIGKVGFDVMSQIEESLTKRAFEGMKNIPHLNILGADNAEGHHGIISFTIDDVHPHDVSAILEADGIDVRAGHHCAGPLLEYLGVNSATRLSLMFYNTEEEIDAFIKSLSSIREKMGFKD